MRPVLLAAAFMLTGCMAADPDSRDQSADTAADTSALSCAELADLRAAEQYEAETAPLDERDGGLFQDSGLLRDFVVIDAAARRRAVEEECQRLRSQPDAGATPVAVEQ